MKKIILIFSGLLFSYFGYSQDSTTTKMHKEMHSTTTETQKDAYFIKDCIEMKDGKMWLIKTGTTSKLKSEIQLENGSIVKPDGTLSKKDGKVMKLKNYDCVYMDGKLDHLPMKDK